MKTRMQYAHPDKPRVPAEARYVNWKEHADRSRHKPHQGKREMARRVRQMEKAAAHVR